MLTVRALAEDIGPREAGSDAERRAAHWLAEQFRHAGYDVAVDTFPAITDFVAVYAPLTALGVASLVLAWWWPLAGVIGGLGSAALLALENLSFQVFSRLIRFRRSQNVIARRPPSGQPDQDIIVTAHVDSGVVSDVRNVVLVWLLFLGILASCVAVAVVSAAVLVGAPRWALLIGLPFALNLTICTGIMLHQAITSPVVAGAGDNASGVAAMLQAARELPALRRSTVWLVGTGAEESGLMGAVELLRRHPFSRQRSWFINLDMVCGGTLRTARVEGMLIPLDADPVLCRIAAEEGAAEGITVGSEVLRAMSTDGCVPLVRGYRTVTLSSSEGYWHQVADTADNVSPATVAHAALLIRRMIERLDAPGGDRPLPD